MQDIESNKPKIPYLCAKCGGRRGLKMQSHRFRFRPIVGWIALPFGMTIEFVWKAPIYLCQQCAENMKKRQQISGLPVVIGILIAALCLYLTFMFLDYGFTFLILGLICFLGGFILYAVLYSSADPKAKVTRQNVILEIPGHGAFDYTGSGEASRIK